MSEPTSTGSSALWKWKLLLIPVLATMAILFFRLKEQERVDIPPADFFADLFPFPEEPFDPAPGLPPEPPHRDDPEARERFARLAATLRPLADLYDQVPVYDAIIAECGTSPDRAMRAGVGKVMMTKAALVFDRRQLAPLYDEIIERSRAIPEPQAEIAEIWARTGRAVLQIRRKHRQMMLDGILRDKAGKEHGPLRDVLLRTRQARIEEEMDRPRRMELCAALIRDALQTRNIRQRPVHETLKQVLKLRLEDAREVNCMIALSDELMADCPGENGPTLKSLIVSSLAQIYPTTANEKTILSEYALTRFGADPDPEVRSAYLAAVPRIAGQHRSPLIAFGDALALAREKGFRDALPTLFAEWETHLAATAFPASIGFFRTAGKPPKTEEEWMRVKKRLDAAASLPDTAQARIEIEDIIRSYQAHPDEKLRNLAVNAWCSLASLAPEPRERLAICNQALALFSDDASMVAYPDRYPGAGYQSLVAFKSRLIKNRSVLDEYYRRLVREHDDNPGTWGNVIITQAKEHPKEERFALLNLVIERFDASHRPHEQELVAECLKIKAGWPSTSDEDVQTAFRSLIDAHYYSRRQKLRRHAQSAISEYSRNLRSGYPSPPDLEVETNRLRTMIVDSCRSEDEVASALSSMRIFARNKEESRRLSDWMAAQYGESRITASTIWYVLFDAVERDGTISRKMAFRDRTITDFRSGNSRLGSWMVREAYRRRIETIPDSQEKLRLWDDYIASSGNKPSIGDLLDRAALLQPAGMDPLPAYEEIFAELERRYGPRASGNWFNAYECMFDLLDTNEKKLSLLDEAIARFRSSSWCYGKDHKRAIMRKSDILGDPSIKTVYFSEVLDWYAAGDVEADGIIIDSLNELAKMAEDPDEEMRLYAQIVATPGKRPYGDSQTHVLAAFQKLIDFEPAPEEKIRLYEQMFELFEYDGGLGSYWLREERKQYEQLLNRATATPPPPTKNESPAGRRRRPGRIQ